MKTTGFNIQDFVNEKLCSCYKIILLYSVSAGIFWR